MQNVTTQHLHCYHCGPRYHHLFLDFSNSLLSDLPATNLATFILPKSILEHELALVILRNKSDSMTLQLRFPCGEFHPEQKRKFLTTTHKALDTSLCSDLSASPPTFLPSCTPATLAGQASAAPGSCPELSCLGTFALAVSSAWNSYLQMPAGLTHSLQVSPIAVFSVRTTLTTQLKTVPLP